MSKYDARLEDWYTYKIRGFTVLMGRVYEDSARRFRDGEDIYTSKIQSATFKEGEIVRTMNTRYLLGKQLKERQ